MENFFKKVTKDVDLSFAILLSFCVYVFFSLNIEIFLVIISLLQYSKDLLF